MENLLNQDCSIEVIKDFVAQLPKGQKRGAYKLLAESAGVFPSYLSQIFKGERTLNSDQALGMAEHMNFDETETKYFLLLVERERAQTPRLKSRISKEIDSLRSTQRNLARNLKHEILELSPEDNARFYSSWIFAAVRLLVAIPRYASLKAAAARLGVSERRVSEIMRFLVQTGLCKNTGSGFEVGPAHTHLPKDSPLIAKHHANWRMRAIENQPFLDDTRGVSYSVAVTLSEADAKAIHGMIVNFIKSIRSVSDPSPPEALYCFNLDWFEV